MRENEFTSKNNNYLKKEVWNVIFFFQKLEKGSSILIKYHSSHKLFISSYTGNRRIVLLNYPFILQNCFKRERRYDSISSIDIMFTRNPTFYFIKLLHLSTGILNFTFHMYWLPSRRPLNLYYIEKSYMLREKGIQNYHFYAIIVFIFFSLWMKNAYL